MNKDIDYNTQQFKWAKEIMKEKDIVLFDINWNKFKTREEIEQFIDMLIDSVEKLKESDD